MSTIVVAVDISPQAQPVIAALKTLNVSAVEQVILAHVIPLASTDADVPADVPGSNQAERDRLWAAEEFLHQLAADVESICGERPAKGVSVEVVSGDPADEIVRLAGIHQASLIVLGTRGLEGMHRAILGSVSNQVIESAACSVFVVKTVENV